MKLRDITNSQCDVRKYMSIEVSDEARNELENWGYDVDDVLNQARIYIDGNKLDEEIAPFEFNENQQNVLDTLKDDSLGSSPFFTIWHTMENNQLFNGKGMTVRQQFEVLASFAEWGMENEQED